jgi:hypothetical protein
MTFAKPFAVLLLLAAVLLAQGPHGAVPRASATSYSAHAAQDGLQIGATLLSHKEEKKLFAAGVDQCCQVVEVAFYPPKDNFVKIALDDFMLRETGKDIGVKPSTAEVLAAQLEVRPQPYDREHKAGIGGSSEIGYERGRSRDPYTGTTETRSGIYERQSIGVGIPIGGKQQPPEQAAADSRRAIEAELKEKGLPETSAWEPVAGYLYFAISKKPKEGFELVYTAGEKKIVLPLK